jgi:hypothetical protein
MYSKLRWQTLHYSNLADLIKQKAAVVRVGQGKDVEDGCNAGGGDQCERRLASPRAPMTPRADDCRRTVPLADHLALIHQLTIVSLVLGAVRFRPSVLYQLIHQLLSSSLLEQFYSQISLGIDSRLLSSDVSIKVCCSFEKWVHEFDMQLHFSRP